MPKSIYTIRESARRTCAPTSSRNMCLRHLGFNILPLHSMQARDKEKEERNKDHGRARSKQTEVNTSASLALFAVHTSFSDTWLEPAKVGSMRLIPR